MKKIWFEREMMPEFLHLLKGFAEPIGPAYSGVDDAYSMLEDADAAIAGVLRYDGTLMDMAPKLQVVARTGIGVDLVDIPAATARGIAVVNVPDGATKSTAEQAVMLMMAVAKNLKQSEMRLQAGEKDIYKRHDALELFGKTLGLAGFGRIARHVAQVCMHGLGMKVMAYDPYVRTEEALERGVELKDSFYDMLAEADMVSLHVPLTPETQGLMDQKAFATMKKGAVFVNAARGGLVKEDALLEALRSKHLFGAGLDVTDPEPPKLDNPLLKMENVYITPHVASGTYTGKRGNFEGAIRQALEVLKGQKPANLLNPEVWDKLVERQNS